MTEGQEKNRVKDKMAKGREYTAKAMAAYASAKQGMEIASKAADKFAHVWRIDEDYLWEMAEAAAILINKSIVTLPWQSSRLDERSLVLHDEENTTFRVAEWTWISVPGTSRLMQARNNSGKIEVRAALKRDIELVRDLVQDIYQQRQEETPTFDFELRSARTSIMSWNGAQKEWEHRKNRTARSFGSVVLPAELQAEIEADLRRFTESRERLQRIEIPWRRGYLLEGPPGTGKTSLSLAIAGTLGFSLASLSLTDIQSDGTLRRAVSMLNGSTVLVIEDIDSYAISRDRDHNNVEDGDLSLSGLLNSLDGFETPEGLITICTTNHVEQLDPALVRAGRLDRTFTLDYIACTEVERLYKWFYDVEPPGSFPDCTGAKLAPAELSEIFKQHFEDPEAGWAAAAQRVSSATTRELVAA